VSLPPFQKLLDAHALDVHRFLVSTIGRGEADDCYQETWLAALRAYPKLRDASNLRGWLLTIAYHKAMDHLRAARNRPIPVDELPELPAAGAAALADDALWSRIRALPAKQRTALTLRYVSDSAYEEISRLMGTSEDAARRNVHEGLKRLRLEYQQ
jgi:RNA polymerase sigma factor (sigma-70 family)